MKNISFQENAPNITALADTIFGTISDPKKHPQWKEFTRMLDNTNEISRLYYFKDKGIYDYRFAQIGHEEKEEERLRRFSYRPFKVVVIKTNPGWTLEDFQDLYRISLLGDIAELAFKIFSRIENPCFLSGPISANKQLPSMEENSHRFFKTIWKLQRAGHNMFDQTPFIEKINIILEQVHEKNRLQLLETILEKVFYQLITSGKITRHLLLDTWRSSYGARWEAMKSAYHAVPTYELRPDFLNFSVKDAQFYLMNLKPFNQIEASKM